MLPVLAGPVGAEIEVHVLCGAEGDAAAFGAFGPPRQLGVAAETGRGEAFHSGVQAAGRIVAVRPAAPDAFIVRVAVHLGYGDLAADSHELTSRARSYARSSASTRRDSQYGTAYCSQPVASSRDIDAAPAWRASRLVTRADDRSSLMQISVFR